MWKLCLSRSFLAVSAVGDPPAETSTAAAGTRGGGKRKKIIKQEKNKTIGGRRVILPLKEEEVARGIFTIRNHTRFSSNHQISENLLLLLLLEYYSE